MTKKKPNYLENLVYKSAFSSTWSARYITNIRIVMLLLLIIIPLGLTSIMSLPRRLNPEVKIPIVTVSTILPGSSPDEVEKLVTNPLEDAIGEIEHVKSYSSTSQENISVITLEFESDVANDDAESDTQKAVDRVSTLPDDAQDPNVTLLDFENQPILEIAITQQNNNYPDLLTKGDEIKKLLEESSLIGNAVMTGSEKSEIEVYTPLTSLYHYNLNPLTLSQTIASQTTSYPAGSVNTTTQSIPVTIAKDITTIDDIKRIPLILEGTPVTLGQISQISNRYSNSSYSYLSQKGEIKRSVSFSIFKTSTADIEDAANAATEILDAFIKDNPDIHLQTITSSASDISDQFSSLTVNFLQTLGLVFVTLFLFLGLRQSTIVSLSIPITFLISLTVMKATGTSLNFLSVFSLLLALGLLVDDAIVVISAMTAYHRTKKFTPDQTAILVWKDFIVPIWSTTLTTVWAFIPLLLSSGIIGEFIKTIPIVVSATLIASTSVAVLITLPVMRVFLRPVFPSRVKKLFSILGFTGLMYLYFSLVPKDPYALFIFGLIVFALFVIYTYRVRNTLGKSFNTKRLAHIANHGFINSETFSLGYAKIIETILKSNHLRKSVVIMTIVFSVISYTLVPLGVVKNEFFPKIDADFLYVEVELPTGTQSEITRDKALEIADYITKRYETIDNQLIEVGRGTNQFESSSSGSNSARITILVPKSISSITLAESLRKDFRNDFSEKIRILEASGGPPAGADIQIEFQGDDLSTLSSLADTTLDILNNEEGIINAEKSIKQASGKYEFTINRNSLTESSLSNDQIGFWLRTYLSDFTLGNLDIDDKEQDIVFTTFQSTPTVEDLGKLRIPSREGYTALADLGTFNLRPNPTKITHTDGVRTITVSGAIRSGFNIPTINAQVIEQLDEVSIPDGYTFKSGGVNEENNNSVNSIFQAMILSAGLILATMVLQLGSFRKALVILLVIPLAISGVFYAFAIGNIPLSFPALIGMLALFGIVVNNSILVVEKINQNLASGIAFRDAIVDASSSRVEPILFGSLTTILGLIPITLSDPLWTGLGGAIIAGLTVSGIIMLFFIPVVYYAWFKDEYK